MPNGLLSASDANNQIVRWPRWLRPETLAPRTNWILHSALVEVYIMHHAFFEVCTTCMRFAHTSCYMVCLIVWLCLHLRITVQSTLINPFLFLIQRLRVSWWERNTMNKGREGPQTQITIHILKSTTELFFHISTKTVIILVPIWNSRSLVKSKYYWCLMLAASKLISRQRSLYCLQYRMMLHESCMHAYILCVCTFTNKLHEYNTNSL